MPPHHSAGHGAFRRFIQPMAYLFLISVVQDHATIANVSVMMMITITTPRRDHRSGFGWRRRRDERYRPSARLWRSVVAAAVVMMAVVMVMARISTWRATHGVCTGASAGNISDNESCHLG